ncbi:MAG: putative iron-regulated protein [Cryomorphaceae bacterium]|jgi:uncharacterized iron-regulated protein
MKTMTCNQLGGACDKEFSADTFDEMAELGKKHGMEMFQKGDLPHLDAMTKMQEMAQSPTNMNEWNQTKRAVFDSLLD